jgi:hypothetical protein
MDARRVRTVGLGLIAGLALAAAPAQASTTIGETFTDFNQGCSSPAATPAIFLQYVSPSSKYAAPTAGVITEWSIQSGSSVAPSLKFKVAHPPENGQPVIVGESAPVAPVANTLNTYDARISVAAGDIIGFSIPANTVTFLCSKIPVSGYGLFGSLQADPAPGDSFFGFPYGESQLSIKAELEPDADADGYGDESQDECPTDPASQAPPCAEPPPPPPLTPPAEGGEPETTINGQPKPVVKLKGKKRKAQVSFAFGSGTAGATFECSLDGAPFAACASPASYKLRKGKHRFAVRAVASGKADSSPATASVKVKRKRKR